MTRKILLLVCLLIAGCSVRGEIVNPVTWSFTSKKTGPNEYDLLLKAKIDKGWHVYSQHSDQSNDAPSALVFSFKGGNYAKIGQVKELGKLVTQMDDIVKHDLKYFENTSVFLQHVKLTGNISAITGTLNFMCCNDVGICHPPEDVDFSFNVKYEKAPAAVLDPPKPSSTLDGAPAPASKDCTNVQHSEAKTDSGHIGVPAKKPVAEVKPAKENNAIKGTLWEIFGGGFLGGLAAIFTPCVFPMIPLTVSFFTKKKDAKQSSGLARGFLFGASIILIYVSIGFIVSRLFGADTLNSMSSNPIFNLAFFAIFFVFALSFLGAFEITLPASWTNSADKQSEKGGLIGIFFMAFTLALVSFSCTGPIVGQLLVFAAYGNGYSGPIVGMFGFSLALALPFTLFAIFPSWMQNLPKSGGWLNSIKVTLGFIELALGLKFLSAADLIYDWGFLKREYFLAIWIVLFALLGLYLLGKIKFSHDTDLPYVTVPRLILAILCFAFTAYMVPGLWGAPVNLLSGIAPPNEYTEGSWVSTAPPIIAITDKSGEGNIKKKYADKFKSKTPLGLDCYYDYTEALAEARRVKKPLMIDFTGIICTNCRLMENKVWAVPRVLQRLKNDVVIVSLFMDAKNDLDSTEVYISKKSGRKITTIGQKWSDFQATVFNSNAEPYYFLLDQDEKLLEEPMGYNSNVDAFVAFLDKAKEEYKKRQ